MKKCVQTVYPTDLAAQHLLMKSSDRTVVRVPALPLRLLNLLGAMPKPLQQRAAGLPSRRTHHFIAFGVTLDIAANSQCSVHYHRLKQHHQMSQRCCITKAPCLFMNFPYCAAYLPPFPLREGVTERKVSKGSNYSARGYFVIALCWTSEQ